MVEPSLAAATTRFWSSPRLIERFSDYLFFVYCSASGAIDAMEIALREARSRAPSDPVAQGVAEYFAAHIEEERDHPEWLLADLEALGIARGDVLTRTPPASVAAMIGAQYFWARRAHPVALLGLLAILEGFPPSASWLATVRQRAGLPAEACRFLIAHAEIDPHHAADLWRLLDRLPLTPSHEALVGSSALHTMSALGEIFETLSGEAELSSMRSRS